MKYSSFKMLYNFYTAPTGGQGLQFGLKMIATTIFQFHIIKVAKTNTLFKNEKF